MGSNQLRSQGFSSAQPVNSYETLSQSFRVLGDATRLRILRLVAQAPLNVTELVSLVGVAQSSVSHHLGKLKGLGLIREERQEGYSYYSLAAVAGAQPVLVPLGRSSRLAAAPAGGSFSRLVANSLPG
jgi:DNA-binding transcriptional ArsR family regulator